MKRILIALFAVLALAFANPSATFAEHDGDHPGQGQGAENNRACDPGNASFCDRDRDDGDNGDNGDNGDDENGHGDDDNAPALANTGV